MIIQGFLKLAGVSGDVVYSPLALLPAVWLVIILIPVMALITALVVWIVKRIKRNKRGRDE